MYKIKKALLIFLCFAIVGGMAACGENPDGASSTAGSEASSSAVSSEATSEQSSDVSAAAQGNVSTASQLTSSEETKPLTLVKRDEETSWIVDFVYVNMKDLEKNYTIADFPELELESVYKDFPSDDTYLFYLKDKTLENAQKIREVLMSRSDVKTVCVTFINNDNSYLGLSDQSGYDTKSIPIELKSYKELKTSDFPTLQLKAVNHIDKNWYELVPNEPGVISCKKILEELKKRDDIKEMYLSVVSGVPGLEYRGK